MITAGKLIHHIESLNEKHEALDRQIIDMQQHHDNDLKIEELKKKKLKLKDEIQLNQQKLNKLI